MVGGKPTVVFSGKPKVGKSTLVNALLGAAISPADALEATATALYISGDVSDGVAAGIKVHRKDGSVNSEEMPALLEKYTGRDARNEDVTQIDIQTTSRSDSRFLPDICFVDTPGIGAEGDFSDRHNEIAIDETQKADVRVHLLTTVSDELGRLRSMPHLIVVRSHSDRLINMNSPANAFEALANEKERFESLSPPGLNLLYCAPLIALGAELIDESLLAGILDLSDCSESVFQELISRACLESELPVALSLSERNEMLCEMSKILVPCTISRYAAWPFYRCACFFARSYQVQEVDRLREMLVSFSGIRELRSVLNSNIRPETLESRRIARLLIEEIKVCKRRSEIELTCLRKRISDMEVALKYLEYAEGAVCEITEAMGAVLDWIKKDEQCRRKKVIHYERVIPALESTGVFPEEDPAALKWILENDCSLPFALRKRAMEVLEKKMETLN